MYMSNIKQCTTSTYKPLKGTINPIRGFIPFGSSLIQFKNNFKGCTTQIYKHIKAYKSIKNKQKHVKTYKKRIKSI